MKILWRKYSTDLSPESRETNIESDLLQYYTLGSVGNIIPTPALHCTTCPHLSTRAGWWRHCNNTLNGPLIMIIDSILWLLGGSHGLPWLTVTIQYFPPSQLNPGDVKICRVLIPPCDVLLLWGLGGEGRPASQVNCYPTSWRYFYKWLLGCFYPSDRAGPGQVGPLITDLI